MLADPIAAQMAAQSTHRHIHEPKRERAPRRRRRHRRATARLLHAIAIRLDPALVRAPQIG